MKISKSHPNSKSTHRKSTTASNKNKSDQSDKCTEGYKNKILSRIIATASGVAIGSAAGHLLESLGSSVISKFTKKTDMPEIGGPCAIEIRQFLNCAESNYQKLSNCDKFHKLFIECTEKMKNK